MRNNIPQTVTANFYFPGTNVVGELVTKENPMTPYRKRKIEAMRMSGYKVIVWHEEDFSTFEKTEKTMRELRKHLGMDSAQEELERYKELRRQNYEELFGSD